MVARFQLIAAGLGAGAIDHRIAVGRLVPVYRGVYAVGHAPLTARGHWIAAVLACGPEALLSHRSAAALWGIAVTSSPLIDVTVPRSRHRQEGIAVHRSRVFDVDDRAVRHRIPVTSVPRTLLDLAEVVSAHRLERTLEEAERLDLIDMRALRRLVERSRGRHGLRPLAALLARSTPARHTRSELERRFLDLIADAGLPPPAVNAIVNGLEVDMLWREQRVVVELDGYAFHRHRSAFERDRRRSLALEAAGYRVLRITWRQLDCELALVNDTLRSWLGRQANPVTAPPPASAR